MLMPDSILLYYLELCSQSVIPIFLNDLFQNNMMLIELNNHLEVNNHVDPIDLNDN